MAAPSLSAKEKKNTLRPNKTKKPALKSVWCNPFIATWPVVKETDVTAIFHQITSVFSEFNFTREKPPWKRGQSKLKDSSDKTSQWSPEQAAIRSQLVFGVNAVTRHLERDQLCLALVNRSVDPPLLTKHLITLCGTRRCPVVCLPELANKVAPLLGITSLVTMGFKKQSDNVNVKLDDLIQFISSRAPEIKLPWMEKDEDDDQTTQVEEPDQEQMELTKHSNSSGQSESLTEVEKSVMDQSASVSPKVLPRLPVDLPLEIFPYKHLYVFKESKEEKQDDFGSSFIQFSKDDDDEADTLHAKDLQNVGLSKIEKKKLIQKYHLDTTVNGSCDKRTQVKKQTRKRKSNEIPNSLSKKRKVDKQGKKKARKKKKIPGGKKVKYHTAVVGLMQPNPTRATGKKKKAR